MSKKRKFPTDAVPPPTRSPQKSKSRVNFREEIFKRINSGGQKSSKGAASKLKGGAESNGIEPRKELKCVKRQRLVTSENAQNASGFVANWCTHKQRDPSFVSLPTEYPTKQSLKGCVFNGGEEIERLSNFFGGFKRTNEQIQQDVETHRKIQQDLLLAERLFADRSKDDGQMTAMGQTVDLIEWRNLPRAARLQLHNDDPKEAFELAEMTAGQIQQKMLHDPVDWVDSSDLGLPSDEPIFKPFWEVPFAAPDPPISCCIFTKHRNARISRCVREPTKALNALLTTRVHRKKLPYFWDRNTPVPAVCGFHYNVIMKEATSKPAHPFFTRALGAHETNNCVQFTKPAQLQQLAQYVDQAQELQQRNYVQQINARFQMGTSKPPAEERLLKASQEIRLREFVDYNIDGMSREQIDKCIEEVAEARRKVREPPVITKDPKSVKELHQSQLPSTSKGPRPILSVNATPPIFNSFVGEELPETMTEEQRLLYKACDLGVLKVHKSQAAEAEDRMAVLLDVRGHDAADPTLLRIYGDLDAPTTKLPRLNFEALPAVTIRHIKKIYKLPNRSGATPRSALLEGLHEFFDANPIDKLKVMEEFFERRQVEGNGTEADEPGKEMAVELVPKRKVRQFKKPTPVAVDAYDLQSNESSSSVLSHPPQLNADLPKVYGTAT